MSTLVTRKSVSDLMKTILERQGKATAFREETLLRDIGFRSLDFSELALRVESQASKPLNFDATPLRSIRSVGDVLDFMEKVLL